MIGNLIARPKPSSVTISPAAARQIRRSVEHLYRLGPRPVFELLCAVHGGADVLGELRVYQRLDPAVVCFLGADRFPRRRQCGRGGWQHVRGKKIAVRQASLLQAEARQVPGGGIASNKNVSPPVRTGSGSHSTNPGYTSQLGNKVGNKVTHQSGTTGYTGERMHDGRDFQPVPFGNEVALNVGGGGPGTGREVSHCGSQGVHVATNPGNPRPNNQRDWADE